MNILKTKVTMPPLKSNIIIKEDAYNAISRPINGQFSEKATIFYGPAGYGKTTLVRSFLEEIDNNSCWFTVGEEDNNPDNFLAYLIASFREFKPDFGSTLVKFVNDGDGKNIITEIINEIFELQEPVYLVLDELENIKAIKLVKLLGYFIENSPANLHIILISKESLALPVASWQAKGKINVINHKILKFNADDIKKYFAINNQELAEEDSRKIAEKTEGWIAAIHMILLANKNIDDWKEIDFEIGQTDSFIFDYLLQDVLAKQSDDIKDFLLKTSILERFNSKLINHLISENAEKLIEVVEEKQLFLYKTDQKGNWYRYHNLFAEALKRKLSQDQNSLKIELHLKAIEWYLENSYYSQALKHAIESKQFNLAGQIIYDNIEEFIRQSKQNLINKYLNLIPEEYFDYELKLAKATNDIFQAKTAQALTIINEIEEHFKEINGQLSSRDKLLKGRLATLKMILVRFIEDFNFNPEDMEIAQKYLPDGSFFLTLVTLMYADILALQGRINEAIEYYRRVRLNSDRDKYDFYIQLAGIKEAVQVWHQGYLTEAKDLCNHLLSRARKSNFINSPRAGAIMALKAGIVTEEDSLEEAREVFKQAAEICNKSNDPIVELFFDYFILPFYYATKDYKKADKIFDKMHQVKQGGIQYTFKRLIISWQVRFYLLSDYSDKSWEDALKLLETQGIKYGDDISPADIYLFINLSRVLIHARETEKARNILNKISEIAEEFELLRYKIEVNILLAEISYIKGNREKSLEIIEKPLKLAEKYGFFRIFLDEASQINPILYKFKLENKSKLEFVDRLLASIMDKDIDSNKEPNLYEGLSPREIEILSLIAEGKSNQEIADEIHLANSTVRWHCSNIYSKLNAANRTEAVKIAEKLNIL